jgi:hypothetical protein
VKTGGVDCRNSLVERWNRKPIELNQHRTDVLASKAGEVTLKPIATGTEHGLSEGLG